jgi:hypothetical protein
VCDFRSLFRIIIPSSAEVIGFNAFSSCPVLTEVILESRRRLADIHGFERWTSLCRIIIPSSMKRSESDAFLGPTSPDEAIFEMPTFHRL